MVKKEAKEQKEKAKKAVKAEKVVVKAKPTVEKKVAEKVASKAQKTTKKAGADTGSVDFQVQNFTEKIQLLSSHLKKHPHDFDSRRGLLIMVGKRRRLLNYYKKKDVASYEKLAASLKLKK